MPIFLIFSIFTDILILINTKAYLHLFLVLADIFSHRMTRLTINCPNKFRKFDILMILPVGTTVKVTRANNLHNLAALSFYSELAN